MYKMLQFPSYVMDVSRYSPTAHSLYRLQFIPSSLRLQLDTLHFFIQTPFTMRGLLTLSFAALATAIPAAEPVNISERAVSDVYRFFQGDGSTNNGWPSMAQWGTFDELWAQNLYTIEKSCKWINALPNNSPEEIKAVKAAILQLSKETGVDNRFILAVVMQESAGCVRVKTSSNAVRNPGMMQSHKGTGTCEGVSPCPASMITQMIRDGVQGTATGSGLKGTLAKAVGSIGATNARAYYGAARLYNSGRVDWGNLNNGFTSTACYATDVASRLLGWSIATKQCRA